MRFIVDLYRFIIFAACGAAIIAVVLAVLTVMDRTRSADLTGATIAIGVAMMVMVVLSLGSVAILISFHDRHAEIVDQAERIAKAVESIAKRMDADV